MRVAGYDYAAFCAAIAERDGPSCWVHRLLAARRAAVIERWRTEGFGDVDRCAGWVPGGLLRCDGPLDGHHLLSKSWIKREFGCQDFPLFVPSRVTASFAPGTIHDNLPVTHVFESLATILNDPRNGIAACRRHHDLIEGPTEAVKIRRTDLPPHAEEFAAELGDRAVGRLERDYGTNAERNYPTLGGQHDE